MAGRGGVRESARDIERELRAQIETVSELDDDNAALAKQIKAFIQSKTPIDTGDAVGSIQIAKLRKTQKHPLPGRRVFSDSWMFHMLEYGTGPDPANTKEPRRIMIDGKWVTVGRNTPTQAAAPFGKAQAQFGDKIR